MWLRNRVSLFFLDKYNIYLYLDNIKWQVFFFGQDETPRESRLGLLPDCHLKVVLTQNSHFKSSNSKLTGRLARGIWYFRSQPTLTSRPKKKTCLIGRCCFWNLHSEKFSSFLNLHSGFTRVDQPASSFVGQDFDLAGTDQIFYISI